MTVSRPLFVAYAGLLGGAEQILVDAVIALRDRGDDPMLLAPAGPLTDAVAAAGTRVYRARTRPLVARDGVRAGANQITGLFGLARETRRAVAAGRPSVVVAWSARPTLALAARGPRHVPWVAVHNDLVPRDAVGTAVRRATRRATATAALSHAIAATLGNPNPIAVLHPGVDPALWPSTPPPRSGPTRAVWLGALVPWKRPELAIEIAARVPDLHLDLFGSPIPGDDDVTPVLSEQIHRLGLTDRVRLRGYSHEVARELAGAHLLLHTADAEPYGMVIAQALACGCPVVAPDGGGPRELVTPGAGQLFTPGDPDAGARAVAATVNDPDAPTAAARRGAELSIDAFTDRLRVLLSR